MSDATSICLSLSRVIWPIFWRSTCLVFTPLISWSSLLWMDRIWEKEVRRTDGSMPVCVSCPLRQLSPTVCPVSVSAGLLHIVTSWSNWVAVSLVSWFLQISIALIFYCQRIHIYIWKTFCSGLGPAQERCWPPVAEFAYRCNILVSFILTSYR